MDVPGKYRRFQKDNPLEKKGVDNRLSPLFSAFSFKTSERLKICLVYVFWFREGLQYAGPPALCLPPRRAAYCLTRSAMVVESSSTIHGALRVPMRSTPSRRSPSTIQGVQKLPVPATLTLTWAGAVSRMSLTCLS